ncbi:uncharacterized protein LOC123523530 isoform X2 [Mercenaria mercenaria]|uniref:uncharacterized protein LOC123523530 isoform X2 n=1 Tax=Mercenaria mercenaria TaxID=6596 RepID=UPI001E1DB5CD|nr:uncharacterized protein LOC123523530 isoform X2 [Mercenaria mercenaria]
MCLYKRRYLACTLSILLTDFCSKEQTCLQDSVWFYWLCVWLLGRLRQTLKNGYHVAASAALGDVQRTVAVIADIVTRTTIVIAIRLANSGPSSKEKQPDKNHLCTSL